MYMAIVPYLEDPMPEMDPVREMDPMPEMESEKDMRQLSSPVLHLASLQSCLDHNSR